MNQFLPTGNYVNASNGSFFEWGTPRFDAENAVQVLCLLEPHFVWKEDKVPSIRLTEAIQFFRAMMRMSKNEGVGISLDENEYYQNSSQGDVEFEETISQMEGEVWISRRNGFWGVYQPRQFITRGSVTTPAISFRDHVAIVIHSHGTLPAYFSETDDQSDLDGFVYVVMGHLDTTPVIRARVAYCGFYMEVNLNEIFETENFLAQENRIID